MARGVAGRPTPSLVMLWRADSILKAESTDQVLAALHEAEQAVEAKGLYAAGFVAYEAAPGFDRAPTQRVQLPMSRCFGWDCLMRRRFGVIFQALLWRTPWGRGSRP